MRKIRNSISALIVIMAFALYMHCLAYAEEPTIGTVATTMTSIIEPSAMSTESELGNYVADAVRSCLETDIAIINGGDFYANLCGGDITEEDIRFLFGEDRQMARAQISPQTLKDILETAFSHIVFTQKEQIDYMATAYSGYPQISGITLQLDVSAPAGQRVLSVKLDKNGETLDLQSTNEFLSLAATENMLDGAYDLPAVPYQAAEYSIVDAVLWQIENTNGLIQSPGTGRVTILGTNETWLFDFVPAGVLMLLVVFFVCSRSFVKGFRLERRPQR